MRILVTFMIMLSVGWAFSGIEFSHKDWILACDNTGVCRLAGYQNDDDENLISVMFEREAGENSVTKAKFVVDIAEAKGQTSGNGELFIDGKSYGEIKLDLNQIGELNQMQTNALLNALKGSVKIEFRGLNLIFTLSSSGFNATLLKADEFQGRIKGKTPYPPKQKPVIKAAKTPKNEIILNHNDEKAKRLFEILKSAVTQDECENIYDKNERSAIWINELNDNEMLVQTRCHLGAYNMSILGVIMDKSLSNITHIIGADTGEYSNGMLNVNHKIRGLGDCWYWRVNTWNGKEFTLESEGTTGLCKGFNGGAWDMPTFVSKRQE